MQYSAQLKHSHLIQIINLNKNNQNHEKPDFEIPLQLAIIDEVNPTSMKLK